MQLDAVNRLANSLQAEVTRLHCGEGEWYRVAYLNMSDPSQHCPSPWGDFTSDGIRGCSRPNSTERISNCLGVLYPVRGPYSKICGRVIGYQFGSPDAFGSAVTHTARNLRINEPYLDGISITHGTPNRKHIWTYAAGATESGNCSGQNYFNCPCSNSSAPGPPSYVGNHYYCESANQGDCFVDNRFFPNDPIWDGHQCDRPREGTCCTGANTPPWFSVELRNITSDDIEVRICHDQDTTDEDTPIQLLELYIQ